MENTTYIGLSKLVVLSENMSTIANNVANMNTAGFRGQNMVFTEFLTRPSGQKGPLSMVLDYGQYQVTDPGPVKITGNSLDAALVGPGWFGVVTPGGIQYSRAGNFTLNANGELVTARGLPVAGAGGGTITIPQEAREITIGRDGAIATEDGQLGALMVVEFPDLQKLEPAGNGLYKTDEQGQPATATEVVQGSLEGSNVQPVVEMTRMIDVLREYQSVQRLMQSEHDRIRTAIQRLSRSSGA